MRLYDSVCISCNKNRIEMATPGIDVPQRQTVSKVKSQRPSHGVITVSSWQGSQDQQQQQYHTRSWPSSSTAYAMEPAQAAAEEADPCQDTKRRTQSVSGDFTSDPKGAASSPSKPLIHHQRHNLKNKFHVLNTLGEGTYGKVKLATDKGTGEQVAIKYIKKTKIQDETDQARIRREIQILSSLRHEHIVNVREVFEKKDKIVLVMDYAPGGELYDYLNKMGKLSEEEARRIFRQIVSAVHHCHENGIVHRDLKLENIILDNEGNVKIADFGLSNYFGHNSTLSTFCGSPLYASPEIVNGKPYHGPEVDVWSLGVILYTLVYGAMPFESSNVSILRQQISHGLYSEPIQSSEAAGLIHHLLTVAPSRRATMEDILHHWWVNFNYSCMPNNKPYKPEPELADPEPGLGADRDSKTALSPGDHNQGNVSSDSDVEMDVGQNLWSVKVLSDSKKGINVSSSETVSHVSEEHRYGQSGDVITEPSSTPSGLSKLPQEVLEILLKGCSKKTLKALFGTETTSSVFDSDLSRDVYKVTSKNEEESRKESSEFVQSSHTMSEPEKRPARGILKRKGKFSGGDSGCVINEEMARNEDISVQNSNHFPQKLLPSGVGDAFAMKEYTSGLVNNNALCRCHDNNCTATSHLAVQHTRHQGLHQAPLNVQGTRSSQDIHKQNIPSVTVSPSEACTHTSVDHETKLHFACDCKSTNESAKTVALPKSILKNCKRPSLEDGMKRLSISSYGSNSSVDMFDLSYDSADSGHFVSPRTHFPHGKLNNIDDSGFHEKQTVGSDQTYRHINYSTRVVPATTLDISRETRQRSKSH